MAALAELWGFDWRWLVRDAPPFADLLSKPDREVDPVAGDIWLWACTNWTTQRRAALAQALQRWWADRTASAPAPTIAVLRTLPPEEWRGLFAHLTAAECADPALGEVLAARLQAAPAPAVVSTRSFWPGIELLSGIACQPQHPAILAAITGWPTGRTRTAALALRAELARDPGGADAWFADALGGQLGDPDPEGYGRRAALTPWTTIGCWLHRPNPDRLAHLRTTWHLEPARPLWCWLAIQLGRRTWPGRQLLNGTHPAESLIPLTLLGDALADMRPLTQPARTLLVTWAGWQSSELAAAAQALPTDARVCDWAIACLLTHDALISAPAGAGGLSTFVAKPLAERTAIVQQASASTGLALTTLQTELSLQQAGPNGNGF